MRKILPAIFGALLLATPAFAQDLLIGLIPEQNVFRQMERHRPLADYLSSKLGVRVNLTMLSRYGNILESFSGGKLDAAFWGSFTGALAVQKLGVVPVARSVELDGTSTYTGLIFVRKDSGISTFAGLRGKSFAFVDRATTAGFLFPLALLNSHGERDPARYFSSHFFSGSHDAAILSVLNGESVGGSAKNTIYQALSRQRPEIADKLRVLAESAPVPSNTLGVRKDLDPALVTKLKDALLSMDRDPAGKMVLAEFGALRFVPTSASDYAPVFEMAGKSGVNLQDYTYMNK